MKYILAIGCFIYASSGFTQINNSDIVNGITIFPVYHGSVVFDYNESTIYVDPHGGIEKFKGISDPDLILITHTHGDHLDLNTLAVLNTAHATFIVPEAVAKKIPSRYKNQLVILNNGNKKQIKEISVTALPMYNLPHDETARHKKGVGNGYIISLNNTRIYVSGDTEDIPEMRSLKDIDVAFVCMNLPYTMNIEQAADAVLEFQPKIIYPYHYRGRPDVSDINLFKKKVNDKNNNIDVRLRKWY
ncbi:MBL fold metallo-hydrolase [Zhouia amylolytica]|uniref:Metallo-hydrolase/oxidoreductase n=1 Tax=Zhouia amylolytica AD3 TaxID=1286632 RepID=W2UPX8_9FLAO|nr:MBL fold metallo-hydrolase [Zhouia amylolytica]ETN95357.1 metallo-hydrolase/oxidoreductase [Zhouia amylolytica AD3]